MTHDDAIRELLRNVTPDPVVAIDVEAVRRGARRRRARAALSGVAAAVVIGSAGTVGFVALRHAADQTGPADPPPSHSASAVGSWQRLPDLPLSPRWDSFTAWTGTEALVIGGLSQDFVGGPAPIPSLRDGAAFNPATATWRGIASAPAPLGNHEPSTLIGDTLVIAHWNGWLAYDIGDDQWRRLADPPIDVPQPMLAADGDHVYVLDAYVGEGGDAPIQVLDPATNTWSELPSSTHQPKLDQRTLVTTPRGLVVMGDDFFPRQAGHQQESAHAELWDGTTWTRFSDSDVQGCCWHWTGERIISTYRLSRPDSDQGRGHTWRPGALSIDTETWSALPWLPDGDRALLVDAGWPVADGPLVFSNGYLYDDGTGSSSPVPSPDGTLSSGALTLGGGVLLMAGGYHVDPDQPQERVTPVEPTNEAWMTTVR